MYGGKSNTVQARDLYYVFKYWHSYLHTYIGNWVLQLVKGCLINFFKVHSTSFDLSRSRTLSLSFFLSLSLRLSLSLFLSIALLRAIHTERFLRKVDRKN